MPTQEKDVNIDNFFEKDSKVEIDENERLKFAKQILFGLAIICAGVFISYAFWPENKALTNMFELIKIGALPLITLVITFYFPNMKK